MPNYEFINRKTGKTITLQRTVAERLHPVRIQGGVFYPIRVPSRVAFVGTRSGHGGAKDVLKGYYSQECKLGSKFRSEFKADAIKKAWSTPYDK